MKGEEKSTRDKIELIILPFNVGNKQSFVVKILFKGGMDHWKFFPRDNHYQSVVSNKPTKWSTLGVSEVPLGDQ